MRSAPNMAGKRLGRSQGRIPVRLVALFFIGDAGFGVTTPITLSHLARTGELPISPFCFRSLSGPFEQLGYNAFTAPGWALVRRVCPRRAGGDLAVARSAPRRKAGAGDDTARVDPRSRLCPSGLAAISADPSGIRPKRPGYPQVAGRRSQRNITGSQPAHNARRPCLKAAETPVRDPAVCAF